LVRDGGGHAPEAVDAADLLEALLEPPPLGHVGEADHRTAHRAFVDDRRGDVLHRQRGAVAAQERVVGHAHGLDGGKRRAMRVNEIVDGRAHEIVDAAAEEGGGHAVGHGADAVPVDGEDAVAGRLEEQLALAGHAAQLFLGALARGDVAQHAVGAENAGAFVRTEGRSVNPDPGAVLAPQAELAVQRLTGGEHRCAAPARFGEKLQTRPMTSPSSRRGAPWHSMKRPSSISKVPCISPQSRTLWIAARKPAGSFTCVSEKARLRFPSPETRMSSGTPITSTNFWLK